MKDQKKIADIVRITGIAVFLSVSPVYAEGPLNLERLSEVLEGDVGPIDGQEGLMELKESAEGKEIMLTGDEFKDYNPFNAHKAEPLIADHERNGTDGLEGPFFQELGNEVERDSNRAMDAVEDRYMSALENDEEKNQRKSEEEKEAERQMRMHDKAKELTKSVIEPTDSFPPDEPGLNEKWFEIAPEYYWYKYTESIGVKDEGWKLGLRGAITHKLTEHPVIDSLKDIFGPGPMFNVLKAEARVSYGEVDYEGTGTVNDIPDFNLEGRITAGYDVPLSHSFLFTPYAGFGYRYLLNQFSVAKAEVIDGQAYSSGYDRESTYFYVPIGFEAKMSMDHGWAVLLTGEFDYFLQGEQVSHFEDSRGLDGETLGYDKLKNDQDHGLGWRAGLKLIKATPRIDFFQETYIRFWHIEDSEFNFRTIQGDLICDEDDFCLGGIEPDNKTWEIGFNMGAKF